jgi:hypothetical protein
MQANDWARRLPVTLSLEEGKERVTVGLVLRFTQMTNCGLEVANYCGMTAGHIDQHR